MISNMKFKLCYRSFILGSISGSVYIYTKLKPFLPKYN